MACILIAVVIRCSIFSVLFCSNHAESPSHLQELQDRLDALTPREREVFGLVTTGLLNKRVAMKLGTSEKTIKVHRGRVMRKMRARSFADLVRMAGKLGVTTTDEKA